MPVYIPGVRLPAPALGFTFPNALEQAHLGTSSLYIEDQGLKMLPREHRRQFFLGKQERRVHLTGFSFLALIVPLPSPSLRHQLCP